MVSSAGILAVLLSASALIAMVGAGTASELNILLDTAWTRTLDGPAHLGAGAQLVDFDGNRIFVGGSAYRHGTGNDWSIAAYDAGTGTVRWTAEFGGTVLNDDRPHGLAACPSLGLVVATGFVHQATPDAATVAWDAATGALVWSAILDSGDSDLGFRVAASPGCTRLFVLVNTQNDASVVAYDPATGQERWRSPPVPGGVHDLLVRGDGAQVVFSGGSIVALDAATGAEAWRNPGHGLLAESPDGRALYSTRAVRETLPGLPGEVGVERVEVRALDAGTGRELWRTLHPGTPLSMDTPYGIGVSPDGARAYVTAARYVYASAGGYGTDAAHFITLALNTADGRLAWEADFTTLPTNPFVLTFTRPHDLLVHPDADIVFVTGASDQAHAYVGELFLANLDVTTLAYHGATGAPLGIALYDGPAHSEPMAPTGYPTGIDIGRALALDVERDVLFVAGQQTAARPNLVAKGEMLTIAYDLSAPMGLAATLPGR